MSVDVERGLRNNIMFPTLKDMWNEVQQTEEREKLLRVENCSVSSNTQQKRQTWYKKNSGSGLFDGSNNVVGELQHESIRVHLKMSMKKTNVKMCSEHMWPANQ